MKDNRLLTPIWFLFGLYAKVYMPRFLYKTVFTDCGRKRQSDSLFSFDELCLSEIDVESSLFDADCPLVFFTTKRYSPLSSFLSRFNLNKIAEYCVVPSFDNPRWLVPAKSFNLGSMVNPSSLKACVAILLFRFFNFFGLGHMIFPHRISCYSSSKERGIGLLNDDRYFNGCQSDSVCSVYLGSFGPLQKTTFEFVDADLSGCYAKVSDNKRTHQSLDNEKKALSFMAQLGLKNIIVPDLVGLHDIPGTDFRVLMQSSLPCRNKPNHLSNTLSLALTELHKNTLTNDSLIYCGHLKNVLSSVSGNRPQNSNNLHQESVDIVREEILYHLKNKSHFLTFSHGDFTRWNVFEKNEHIYAFDWEEAKYRTVGYDFFHFVLIENLLVHCNDNIHEYCSSIREQAINNNQFLNGFFYKKESRLWHCLRIYLIEIISVYLWHAYIHAEEGYPKKENIDHILKFCVDLVKYLRGMGNDEGKK